MIGIDDIEMCVEWVFGMGWRETFVVTDKNHDYEEKGESSAQSNGFTCWDLL